MIAITDGQKVQDYVQQMDRQRESLSTISLIFHNERKVDLPYCQTGLISLNALRCLTRNCRYFLEDLHRSEAMRPGASILKLNDLDYKLTELLLAMEVFMSTRKPLEKMKIHLFVYRKFPVLLGTIADTLSQLKHLGEQQ